MKTRRKIPDVVFRDGKPRAVVLDFDEYETLLERVEQFEDLRILRAMRRRPLRFRKLEAFLKEYSSRV